MKQYAVGGFFSFFFPDPFLITIIFGGLDRSPQVECSRCFILNQDYSQSAVISFTPPLWPLSPQLLVCFPSPKIFVVPGAHVC